MEPINPTKMPFYAKAAFLFICILGCLVLMHLGKAIILPLLYATLVAILLNPLVNFFTRHKIPKTLAISLAVLMAALFMGGILLVMFSQIAMFNNNFPELYKKFNIHWINGIHWLSDRFNIRESKINKWVTETEMKAINGFEIEATLYQLGRVLITATLLPVYVFMILFYKPLLLEFIRKIFKIQHHTVVVEVLSKSKHIIQSYLIGLFFEMLIMAVLNSTGLLILGIDYAIIIGITGAILNIIPYIGGIVAIALPMVIAFVTKDSIMYPIAVFFIYLFTQFIDNHYVSPRIVASRVKINALISIIVVILGGAIWGVPGMFISIPLTAILKVMFDHIEPLKPWGYLLGNTIPNRSRLSFIKKGIKKNQEP